MKNLKLKIKQNNAITLVALIITIIILLILAGITIAQLTSNGIFDKAKTAKQVSENAQEDEQIEIEKYTNAIDMISERNKLSSQVILYQNDNATNTTGNITLNQNVDNFNRFTVYCSFGGKVSKYFEVYEKGKNVLLDGQYRLDNSHFRDASIEICIPTSGNTATISNAVLDQNGGWFDQCHVSIYKIVGYTD